MYTHIKLINFQRKHLVSKTKRQIYYSVFFQKNWIIFYLFQSAFWANLIFKNIVYIFYNHGNELFFVVFLIIWLLLPITLTSSSILFYKVYFKFLLNTFKLKIHNIFVYHHPPVFFFCFHLRYMCFEII